MKLAKLLLLPSLVLATQVIQADDSALKTDQQIVSYVLGTQSGERLKLEKIQIDMDALALGLQDELADKEPRIDQQTAEKVHKRYQTANQLKRMAAKKKEQDNASAFLAKNAKEKGVTTTKSGLQYRLIEEGNGDSPHLDDNVIVHIIGKKLDGTVFMDTHKEGEPSALAVNNIVLGWSEALQLMKPGAKLQAVIPPHLLVHIQRDDLKGPLSDMPLIFDFELLSIKRS